MKNKTKVQNIKELKMKRIMDNFIEEGKRGMQSYKKKVKLSKTLRSKMGEGRDDEYHLLECSRL